MEASNVSRLATNEDELSFEASASDMTTEAADGGLGDETMRSRQSNISSMSKQSTFRDTMVDEEDASSLMHCQSLASIVNNPKKDSLVRKMASMVKSKVVGSKEPKFKAMTEAQVEDSPAIPKVNPQKDFKDYMRKVSQPSVQTYLNNHPRPVAEITDEQGEETKRIKEVDPFQMSAEVKEEEKKKRDKAGAGGERKRSSKK